MVTITKQVEGQKIEKVKLVEVDKKEEWEVKKILNKRKIRSVMKYLVHWKGFTGRGLLQKMIYRKKRKIWKMQKN